MLALPIQKKINRTKFLPAHFQDNSVDTYQVYFCYSPHIEHATTSFYSSVLQNLWHSADTTCVVSLMTNYDK